MHNYPCCELTFDINLDGFEIRTWIDTKNMSILDAPYTEKILESIYDAASLINVHSEIPPNLSSFMEQLQKTVPNINAAQVNFHLEDGSKLGFVTYFVDFNDIKG